MATQASSSFSHPAIESRNPLPPQASTYQKAWQRRQLRREFEIYQRLPVHSRLLRAFSCSDAEGNDGDDDDNGEGLVLEYMPKGDLQTVLASEAEITMMRQLQWAVEAAEAVVLLHSYGVIHADIKPENMLLDKNAGAEAH